MIDIPDMGVYALQNIVTGHVYVGSSSKLTSRLFDHTRHMKTGYHPNRKLEKELQRDGLEAFQTVILQRTFDPLELEYLEDLWARRLGAYSDGFNFRSPIRVVKPTEEERLEFDTIFSELDDDGSNDMLLARRLTALEIRRPGGSWQWNAQQVQVTRVSVARRQAARLILAATDSNGTEE